MSARLMAALAALFLLGCQQLPFPGGNGEPTAPAGSLHSDVALPKTAGLPLDGPERFHFVVMSDRTGGHRPGVFPEGVAAVNLLQPALVMSVGDQIEGYSQDEGRLDEEWTEFEGFVDELDAPYFYAPGNHDMSNRVMLGQWQQRFGPTYYHFVYRDVLFLVLNSEIFPGAAVGGRDFATAEEQAEQLAYAEQVLREHAGVRWTFVFVHQPFWELHPVNGDWRKIEGWLGDRAHTVFAGHLHRYNLDRRHGHDRITLATTGGGSRLRGIEYGEFDHVAWVTMTEAGPVVANVMLDGVAPVDIPVKELARERAKVRSAVTLEPFVARRRQFRGASHHFLLENPLSKPLRIQARFEGSEHLQPEPGELDETLAPGAARRVRIRLQTKRPIAFERLEPGLARFRLESEREDGTPLRIADEIALQPRRDFRIRGAPRNGAIDGRLDEWGRLRFAMQKPAQITGEGRHEGPEDGSARFDLAEDETFLYLAVAVRDDFVRLIPHVEPSSMDSVTLTLDFRPEPRRLSNVSFGELIESGEIRDTFFTALSPPVEPGGTRVALMERFWPDGTFAEARLTEEGYAVELAIPIETVQRGRGEDGRGVRLNLGVVDDDGPDDRVTLWWVPDRFGEFALPGTGNFSGR